MEACDQSLTNKGEIKSVVPRGSLAAVPRTSLDTGLGQACFPWALVAGRKGMSCSGVRVAWGGRGRSGGSVDWRSSWAREERRSHTAVQLQRAITLLSVCL